MRPFEALGHRGQLGRLRLVGRAALREYGIGDARLTAIRHEHNTTFRVDTATERFLLRINRPGPLGATIVGSEMAWLRALADETDLGVPEPMSTIDGSPTVTARAPGVPGARVCVLLRWQSGRFVPEGRLAEHHLRRVARLQVGLQTHASTWRPPAGFVRPRVDTLTTQAKLASITEAVTDDQARDHPTPADAAALRDLVDRLVGAPASTVLDHAMAAVWATTRALARDAGAVGLIHGDLHQENYLFAGGHARAIDFDDCGWGFRLYDLVVSLWELEEDDGYERLRDALLDEYARHLPLPPDHHRHLRALSALRRLQILAWVLESRDHPGFRDRWPRWAGQEVEGIARVLDA